MVAVGTAVGTSNRPAAAPVKAGCSAFPPSTIDATLAALNQDLKDHPPESGFGQVVTRASGSQSIDDMRRDMLLNAVTQLPMNCMTDAQKALQIQLLHMQGSFTDQELKDITHNFYASIIAFLGKLGAADTYIRAAEFIGGIVLVYQALKLLGLPALPKIPGV